MSGGPAQFPVFTAHIAIIASMPLTPTDSTDNPEFLDRVNAIVTATAQRYRPAELRVFRIDNWFDAKWFGFAGKTLGALGVWGRTRPIIPPFVRNRLTARSWFTYRQESATYEYAGDGPEIHHQGSSGDNLQRAAKIIAPGAALYWYSGNSQTNGRGSLMGYIPINPPTYWGFYLGFERRETWQVATLLNLNRTELLLLEKCRDRLHSP